MSALRRTLAAGVATGALGALLIAGSAQAASGDRAACTVQGKVSTNPNMLLVGGGGTYAFTSAAGVSPLQFSCAVHRGTTVDVQQFSATSTGSYVNFVCGTGTSTSTPGTKGGTIGAITELGAHPPLADLTNLWWQDSATHTFANQIDLSYTIQFVAGQGVLRFTSSGPGGVTGGGLVSEGFDFDATNPPAPAGCTDHFEWQGAVALVVN